MFRAVIVTLLFLFASPLLAYEIIGTDYRYFDTMSNAQAACFDTADSQFDCDYKSWGDFYETFSNQGTSPVSFNSTCSGTQECIRYRFYHHPNNVAEDCSSAPSGFTQYDSDTGQCIEEPSCSDRTDDPYVGTIVIPSGYSTGGIFEIPGAGNCEILAQRDNTPCIGYPDDPNWYCGVIGNYSGNDYSGTAQPEIEPIEPETPINDSSESEDSPTEDGGTVEKDKVTETKTNSDGNIETTTTETTVTKDSGGNVTNTTTETTTVIRSADGTTTTKTTEDCPAGQTCSTTISGSSKSGEEPEETTEESSTSGAGNCSAFSCNGDAIQCAILKFEHDKACSMPDQIADIPGDMQSAFQSEGMTDINSVGPGGLQSELGEGEELDIESDLGNFLSPGTQSFGTCPPPIPLSLGTFGQHEISLTIYCDFAELIRPLVLLLFSIAGGFVVMTTYTRS